MRLFFISLGCDKNLADTEEMLGFLVQAGHEIIDDETEADVIVINTCCFIHDAMQESIDAILEMAQQKELGQCKSLIVTGCLAQRYREEIEKEIPEVDAILGTSSYDAIVQAIDETTGSGTYFERFDDLDRLPAYSGQRIMTTGGYYSYLKIAEGCDKNCSYCVIPSIRGSYRSVPMDELISQATYLAGQGVRELMLVAQETTMYGVDLYGKKSLHTLLEKLCCIDGLKWIRILYSYPEEIYPDLVRTIKQESKICHYLDMPIQHASDIVLKRMGRRTTKRELIDTVNMLRDEIPDIVLRTTLITGFPGETQKDHDELLDFVEKMCFDRLGVFPYSQEEGTPAASMEDQIPDEVKQQRLDDLMTLQQKISFENGEHWIGRNLEVLIEGRLPREDVYIARSYGDAPGIDGYVFVNADVPLISGDMIPVRITASKEYDLIGEITHEFTK